MRRCSREFRALLGVEHAETDGVAQETREAQGEQASGHRTVYSFATG